NLVPIEVPLLAQRASGGRFGKRGVVDGRRLRWRQGLDGGLSEGLAMSLLDHGCLACLLGPLTLQGLPEHGLDPLAPFLLRFRVTFHGLAVHSLDQLASVLVHGPPSLASQYTGSPFAAVARIASWRSSSRLAVPTGKGARRPAPRPAHAARFGVQ